jgi:hypothetical protein
MESGIVRSTLFLLALILASCGASFGQDTKTVKSLASQLRNATHIGLIENEKLGGYTIIVYTPDQFKQNVDSLAKYKTGWETYQSSIAAIDKRREAALEAKSSNDQLNAITKERNSHQPPFSQFVQGRIGLYRIVEVASDYLEISSIPNTDESTLIPLSKICSVRIMRPKPENENAK